MPTKQPTDSKIVGSASIPLEEWVRMRNIAQEAQTMKQNTLEALKHVQVLLSFLLKGSGEEMGKALAKTIVDFNMQSDVAAFMIENGKVSIKLIDPE